MMNFAGCCNTKENCHFLYERAASRFKAIFVHVSVHKCVVVFFPTAPFSHLSLLSQVPAAVLLQCALRFSDGTV